MLIFCFCSQRSAYNISIDQFTENDLGSVEELLEWLRIADKEESQYETINEEDDQLEKVEGNGSNEVHGYENIHITVH